MEKQFTREAARKQVERALADPTPAILATELDATHQAYDDNNPGNLGDTANTDLNTTTQTRREIMAEIQAKRLVKAKDDKTQAIAQLDAF